jgi:D-alanyl-D-alanine carboxypeptidase/D-alanyl-D-alanine-endopeptidase (penicillin-binding protein 4)
MPHLPSQQAVTAFFTAAEFRFVQRLLRPRLGDHNWVAGNASSVTTNICSMPTTLARLVACYVLPSIVVLNGTHASRVRADEAKAVASPTVTTVEANDSAAHVLWQSEIETILDAAEFKHAHWGLLAVDLASGRTLYERNAEKLFAPASVTKLFSVAAALDDLGAEHRFVTPVYARGTPEASGRLDGDLILVGRGDLTFGGRTDAAGHIAFRNVDHTYAGFSTTAELTDEDPTAGLQELARRIHDAGVRDVRGQVLVDDRLFVHAVGSGSGPDQITPILVNDNVLDFTLTPGAKVGEPAHVAWRPQTAAYSVDAVVDTTNGDAPTRVSITEPVSGQIVVRGTIPLGRPKLVLMHAVEDPASFARALFIEALRKAGIRTSASPLVSNDAARLPPFENYSSMTPMAEFASPRFAESARLILKVSHNLHAGTLPLLLAVQNGKRTLSEGMRLQRAFLERAGVDVDTISFGGGAGGDRGDYVTPRAAVQLLTAMARRDDFASYREALPVLGVDGTLAAAVDEKSPARGRVRAKTGTLLWPDLLNHRQLLQSKALAGYVDAADGRTIVFACFVNLAPLKQSTDRDRIGRVLGTIAEKLYAAPASRP